VAEKCFFSNVTHNEAGRFADWTAVEQSTREPKLEGSNPAALTVKSGNTKGGRITVPLTSCLTGLD
jgi:hypothetical protein